MQKGSPNAMHYTRGQGGGGGGIFQIQSDRDVQLGAKINTQKLNPKKSHA